MLSPSLHCRQARRRARWTAVAALLRAPALAAWLVVLAQQACTRDQSLNIGSVESWFVDPRVRELAAAAERDDTGRVASLVQAGANPNATGRDGMTPLFWALRVHKVNAVRALLAHGADPNGKGPPGLDPLSTAAKAEDPNLLAALLDAKGNPNGRNADGDPLLASAVNSRRPDNVRLLTERGADLNALDHGHSTPVVLAAGLGQWDVVAYLLEHGADPTIPDRVGSTVANTLEDEETGQVRGDPAQAGYRARVKQLLIARGVHFPAEPAQAVRERVFGPDVPLDTVLAREARARSDSLARGPARDSAPRGRGP